MKADTVSRRKWIGAACWGTLSGLTLLAGCAGSRPGTERPPAWSEVLRTPTPSVAATGPVAPLADPSGFVETKAAPGDAAKPAPLPHQPIQPVYEPPAYATVASPSPDTPSMTTSMVNANFASSTASGRTPQWSNLPATAPNEQRPKRRVAGVLHASEADFDQQVLRSDVPVLVDFYASWCGPCKKLAPTLEEVAAETPQAKVIKVDIDNSPGLAARYGVQSVPSLLVFKGGRVVASQTGAVSKTRLKAILDL